MVIKEQWQKILELLQNEVTAVTFDLWISTLTPLSYQDDELKLLAYSTMAKNQVLNKNLFSKIQHAVQTIFNPYTSLKIIDKQENEETIAIEKEKQKLAENNDLDEEQQFKKEFTFDNFVVGKSNQFVHAAMRSVAEHPSSKFNPLFIYGGPGLGKTHLMHAVGNYLKENRPDLKVYYVTCEKFTNDYIESIGSNKTKSVFDFRAKYRNVDVLLIDDIQFIVGKMGIQEEFFHTFNDLYQNNKQIVIASDRPPKEMSALEERLRSRFASGLIQDIQTPDFETRVAILRKKASQEGYLVDSEVIDYIALKSDSNIRVMEAVLLKVFFYASLLNKDKATMEDAYEALKDSETTTKENINSEKIMETVCNFFKVSKEELIGKKKNKEIVEPRQICMYLISEMLSIPLTAIGSIFGGRDHTTVIHARDKITNAVKTNPHIKVIVNDIKAQILKC